MYFAKSLSVISTLLIRHFQLAMVSVVFIFLPFLAQIFANLKGADFLRCIRFRCRRNLRKFDA